MNRLCVAPAQLRDTMSRLTYFHGWDAALVGRLAANANHYVVPRDACLVRHGEVAESLYVVVSGLVRLYIPLPNGAERVIALLGPGEGFGEASLLTGSAFNFSAAACRDSHVIAIAGPAYLGEMRHSDAMKGSSLALLARRLLFTLRDMEICAQPSSLRRVIRFLISLCPEDVHDEWELRLPGRKRDIAGQLALSQETLSRMLAHLGQQGVIEVDGSVIRVASLARLREMDALICGKEAAHA